MNYTHHPQTEGLGEIGKKGQQQRGFGLHTTVAVTPPGQPLGVLAQQFFERPIGAAAHTAAKFHKLPIEEKESYRWVEAFQHTISSSRKGLNMVYSVLSKETKNHIQAHNQDYPNNSF